MTDLRVEKLARVLVQYSLDMKPGEQLAIKTNPFADELNLALYKEALLAGAHPFFMNEVPGMWDIFYEFAPAETLELVLPVDQWVHENCRAIMHIEAEYNTRELTNSDPSRIKRYRNSRSHIFKSMIDRMAAGELKWCLTVFPTYASALEADMSLREYQDFIYTAGMLDHPDPVAAWTEEAQRQQRWIDSLAGKDRLIFKGQDIDLRMSILDRSFEGAAGKLNFPDGEIYTSPVEGSVEGWVRFAYPAIIGGREVIDIELWFEGGKVVREKASKGGDFLTEMLNSDQGSRYLGELGIGTNYAIPRFTKNMLFDEKLGGTIHLAVGAGFPEVGGKNESSLHWDMLCDMAESEIEADGEVFYKNGRFIGSS